MHKPSWFRDNEVLISYAPTCGINKDGDELYVVDPETGLRTDRIDDRLHEDVETVLAGQATDSVRWVPSQEVAESGIAVPAYYDHRTTATYLREVRAAWPDFQSLTLGDLIDSEQLKVETGHGSPSADVRTGTVPYIKVSDLRAGQVNINPTNRVSEVVARRYWHGSDSGLQPFDLLTPSRTSKNIGDLAVLMPGQQRVVLTKEILVMRPGPRADFDPFYLLWAMSLKVVRRQWQRIVFMQTNREDTGQRYREIEVPLAPTRAERDEVSQPFREYYQGVSRLREAFLGFLAADERHHVFLASAEAPAVDTDTSAGIDGDQVYEAERAVHEASEAAESSELVDDATLPEDVSRGFEDNG